MTIDSITPSFSAEWTEENIHLKETEATLCQKVQQVAWDVFSYLIFPIVIGRMVGWAIRFVAKKLTLQSPWAYSKEIIHLTKAPFQLFCDRLQPTYKTDNHIVQTPDGTNLNVFHFRHHESDENTPTVFLFHSNCAFTQQMVYGWLIEEAVKRGSVCNFVAFDYRGVGDSEGEAQSQKELKIDGDTVYQFIRNYLHVPAEKIHWYGWSLGGAVGSNVKALHPDATGPFCNVRSLSSMREIASCAIPTYLKPFLFWFPWAVEQQDWNLQAPLEKLKGETMIVFHKEDSIVPYAASAHQAAMRANLNVISLELNETSALKESTKKPIDHHCEPLHYYYGTNWRRADQAIADFILPLIRKAAQVA